MSEPLLLCSTRRYVQPIVSDNQVWAFVHCVDTPLVLYHCDKQYLTVCPTNNYFLTLRHCVDKPNVSDNHWSELLFNCVDTLLLLYLCVQQTCVFLTQKSDNHFVCALNHSTNPFMYHPLCRLQQTVMPRSLSWLDNWTATTGAKLNARLEMGLVMF